MAVPRDNRDAQMQEIRTLTLEDEWLTRYALCYALELLTERQMGWVLSATESARRQLVSRPEAYRELLRERFGR